MSSSGLIICLYCSGLVELSRRLPGFYDVQHLRCRLATGTDNEDVAKLGFVRLIV